MSAHRCQQGTACVPRLQADLGSAVRVARSEAFSVHILRTKRCQSQHDRQDPQVTKEETETQRSKLAGAPEGVSGRTRFAACGLLLKVTPFITAQ